MDAGERVWFVHTRFEELAAALELRGWPVFERGDLSEWDEGRRIDPVMGVVRIRAHRELPEFGAVASFTVKEWWAHPPVDGPLMRGGVVLAGYHYTAVSLRKVVRHCFDPIRHPGAEEFHEHPDGTRELRRYGFIDVEDALARLEQRLAEELLDADGTTIAIDDEDLADDIFGEE